MPAVATALTAVKRDRFREEFFALPDTQFREINDEIFEWVWPHFEDLLPFFAKAAD